ncbi:MAG: response regulator transcription factor [Isosphaeraceae bacterium]
MSRIRVILADDHRMLRSGLASLLNALPDVEVVAEAGDAEEAFALVLKHQPEILVTDIAMPGQNGLQLAERVAHAGTHTRVLILSMHLDGEYVRAAARSGAAGYVLKDADLDELDRALHVIHRGGTFLSPDVSTQLMADYQRLTSTLAPAPADPAGPKENPLTPRQQDVLRLIAEGKTTKAIALNLGISSKTVETHRTQLMDRLKIHEVAGLVRYAIRSGLVDREP